MGARVYATANGVTQLRIQNGAYHRWSQDLRRSHFGLAGATVVDLRVEWPSGRCRHSRVWPPTALSNQRRRRHAAVALGVAPAYPCGPPPLNGAVDNGIFSGRTARRVNGGSGPPPVVAARCTPARSLHRDLRSRQRCRPQQRRPIEFHRESQADRIPVRHRRSATDGDHFKPREGTSTCMKVTAPRARTCSTVRSANRWCRRSTSTPKHLVNK